MIKLGKQRITVKKLRIVVSYGKREVVFIREGAREGMGAGQFYFLTGW